MDYKINDEICIKNNRSGIIVDKYEDKYVTDYTIQLKDKTIINTSNRNYIKFLGEDKKGERVIFTKPLFGTIYDINKNIIVRLKNGKLIKVRFKDII